MKLHTVSVADEDISPTPEPQSNHIDPFYVNPFLKTLLTFLKVNFLFSTLF